MRPASGADELEFKVARSREPRGVNQASRQDDARSFLSFFLALWAARAKKFKKQTRARAAVHRATADARQINQHRENSGILYAPKADTRGLFFVLVNKAHQHGIQSGA